MARGRLLPRGPRVRGEAGPERQAGHRNLRGSCVSPSQAGRRRGSSGGLCDALWHPECPCRANPENAGVEFGAGDPSPYHPLTCLTSCYLSTGSPWGRLLRQAF